MDALVFFSGCCLDKSRYGQITVNEDAMAILSLLLQNKKEISKNMQTGQESHPQGKREEGQRESPKEKSEREEKAKRRVGNSGARESNDLRTNKMAWR